MGISVDAYTNEPVRYPTLHVVDLAAEGAIVTETYRNMVINRVNDSCLRLAVFDGDYRWHYHPKSDELFIVVEGCLAIDLEDGRELRLYKWQSVTVPAMTVHRTRAIGRTVNVCFEKLAAETVFVERAGDTGSAPTQLLDHQVLWRRWQDPGIEHLHIREQADRVVADGYIVGDIDGVLLRAHYLVRSDTAYQFQSLQLDMTYPSEQVLNLSRTLDGKWKSAAEADIPLLSSCTEIDISVSPFTNTLPIRRLQLEEGQSAEITVAYIEFPELSVRPERQRYTLLQRDHGQSIYYFEHLAVGYSVEITVDQNGLVLDYPELFRRG